MTSKGMFQNRELIGKDWIRQLPEEDRKVWAELGRITLAELDINWHQLGGKTRAKTAKRDQKGRYTK